MKRKFRYIAALLLCGGLTFSACGSEEPVTDSVENVGEVEQALCGGIVCPRGNADCCNGVCTNFSSSHTNCGSCGHTCLTYSTCENGICIAHEGYSCTPDNFCDEYTNCCGALPIGTCKNTNDDVYNCGYCGHVCGDGESQGWECVNGTCKVPCVNHTDCQDNYLCNVNSHYCEQKSCTNNSNCIQAGGQPLAQYNTGAPQWSFGCCSGKCVDLTSDRLNCGSCGNDTYGSGELGCCSHKDFASNCGGNWSIGVTSTATTDWPYGGQPGPNGCASKCSGPEGSGSVGWGRWDGDTP